MGRSSALLFCGFRWCNADSVADSALESSQSTFFFHLDFMPSIHLVIASCSSDLQPFTDAFFLNTHQFKTNQQRVIKKRISLDPSCIPPHHGVFVDDGQLLSHPRSPISISSFPFSISGVGVIGSNPGESFYPNPQMQNWR